MISFYRSYFRCVSFPALPARRHGGKFGLGLGGQGFFVSSEVNTDPSAEATRSRRWRTGIAFSEADGPNNTVSGFGAN